jgi:hypothetical protein
MDRDEEYVKVFGVKPKKPKKAKKTKAATKKATKSAKSKGGATSKPKIEPVVNGDWNYTLKKKKPVAVDKKEKKSIRFLLGLLIVFVVLLVASCIIRLFSA